jgi:hypothetical protein
VAVSAIAAFLRIDAKQPVPLGREILAILAGQVLITLPSYFAQRAVALVTPLAVGVAGALGPFLVFGLQALEGRVAFSTRTLAGLIAYSLGSLIIAVGELMPGRPRHSALPCA